MLCCKAFQGLHNTKCRTVVTAFWQTQESYHFSYLRTPASKSRQSYLECFAAKHSGYCIFQLQHCNQWIQWKTLCQRPLGQAMISTGHAKQTPKKASSTPRASRAVPHPSTDRAFRRLTSEFGWDRVYSTKYGRWRELWVSIGLLEE